MGSTRPVRHGPTPMFRLLSRNFERIPDVFLPAGIAAGKRTGTLLLISLEMKT